MDWSYSSSPLLFQNRIYVIVLRQPKLPKDSSYTGSMVSYLLILDAATGETLHKVDRPTDAEGDYTDAYNTPIPVQIRGKPQILLYGGNYITGHDPVTGAEQWRYMYKKSQQRWGNTAGTPIAEKNRLFCVYLTGTSAFACDLDKLADNEPPCIWTYDKPMPYVPSPALSDGALYYIEEKSKTLICLDAETGRERWVGELDKSDLYYASLTAADGKLYMVNRKGVVTVAAADSEKFCILSTSTFDEQTVDSTISISDGKVYLRTAENLYCFGRKN
jgi:outer membrane protein assembly factor BamB